MISQKKLEVSIPGKKSSFNFRGTVKTIIKYIYKRLPDFKINYNQVIKGKEEESYNNQLSMYLNACDDFKAFVFQNEYKRNHKPDIGLGIRTEILSGNYESVFDIECKRLNTNLQHVKQYVSGKTGGIERFKHNQHGTDLPYSAMIGYVEDKDSNYWFHEINSWINKKIKEDNKFWHENEFLINKRCLISSHYRIESLNPKIALIHFLFNNLI